MKNIYLQEYHVFKDHYQKSFLRTLLLSIVAEVLCFILSLFMKEYFIQQTEKIAKSLADNIEKMSGKHVLELTNYQTFRLIFLNNLKVCLIMVLLGAIPVYRLPAVFSIAQFSVLGIVVGGVAALGFNAASVFIFGILPHGIFELTAIVYSAAIGNFLNKQVIEKIYSRKKINGRPWKSIAAEALRSFLLAVLPLLLAAACLEAYITPELTEMFL